MYRLFDEDHVEVGEFEADTPQQAIDAYYFSLGYLDEADYRDKKDIHARMTAKLVDPRELVHEKRFIDRLIGRGLQPFTTDAISPLYGDTVLLVARPDAFGPIYLEAWAEEVDDTLLTSAGTVTLSVASMPAHSSAESIIERARSLLDQAIATRTSKAG